MQQRNDTVDLLIIGGGINGAGIARDAAGRGLSVMLVEKDDLASHTSSASSKLIHGGLRYLEYYEFRLVQEALGERERLMGIAPHIIWPMRFVLPHDKASRPRWMIRLGLFLYDNLAKRVSLPGSEGIKFAKRPELRGPLADSVKHGFAYSDCWVEDSRLVALNAMDAAAKGAEILTRTRFVDARRVGGEWVARIQDNESGKTRQVRARGIVNAAGPWVSDLFDRDALPATPRGKTRLIKGSHIIVPQLWQGDQAYILQNDDGRIVFAIPYEGRFTLIGTTDESFSGDPQTLRMSVEERDYMLAAVNRWFNKELTTRDVMHSFAGVRPLYDDGASEAKSVTRDYVLELDQGPEDNSPPLLSIFGGKITTYRCLAEDAMDKLAPLLGCADVPSWTGTQPLPGGDIPDGDVEGYVADLCIEHRWVPPPLMHRWVRAYGTRVELLLDGKARLSDLGTSFSDMLYEAEIDYLMEHEFARTPEDVLMRRSKLGLHLSDRHREKLSDWLTQRQATPGKIKAAAE
ncbi:MAG: glycerol-3-phosphate dehydrogenase [Alphaproteobacteria bacterium]